MALLPNGHVLAGTPACSNVNLNGSGVWYPVSMRKDGPEGLKGIFPDLGQEIFGTLDVPVTVGPELPWKRLLTLLEFGQIDVLAGAYLTSERTRKFGVSRPVMLEEVGVFVRTDLTSRPEKLEDLVGLRGVAAFGASFGEEFEIFAAERLSIDRQPSDDYRTDMRLLMEKKADYLVIPRQDGEMMIEDLDAADLVEALPWPATINTLHYLFSRTSPCLELLERFDAELQRRLEGGELDGLVKRYKLKSGDG
ncbi:substrate-binding periplasmic protein [Roseibium sp. M-1]